MPQHHRDLHGGADHCGYRLSALPGDSRCYEWEWRSICFFLGTFCFFLAWNIPIPTKYLFSFFPSVVLWGWCVHSILPHLFLPAFKEGVGPGLCISCGWEGCWRVAGPGGPACCQPDTAQRSSGKKSWQILNTLENGRELTSFTGSAGTWQALIALKREVLKFIFFCDFPLFIY